VYATFQNSTVEDGTKKTASGSGTGAYSTNLTGLTVGTIYYVRAYATCSSTGTTYGEQVTVTTTAYVTVGSLGVQVADLGGITDYSSAVSLCTTSRVGGHSNWRLPTIGELSIMYANKNTIGNFQSSSYWSSNTCHNDYVNDGHQSSSLSNNITGCHNDSQKVYVRCVRTLP
jgi:hypothetical protein